MYYVNKTNKMKAMTTITALLISLSINVTAQVKVKPNNPKPIDYVPRNGPPKNQEPVAQNNQQANNHWGNGNGGWNHGGSYGNITIGFGNPYPYNNYYGNGYSIKKQTRYSIRAASQIINQAVAFDSWNDTYSPLLAKAIRHYNYARQLYWWGNYHAAYNHAERARYLAWYSLQFFQNPNCNDGGGYGQPNPYSDPYNPYYRSDQTGGGNMNEKSGYKTQEMPQNESMDAKLPGSEVNDKELIRTFDKSEMKDE